MLSKTLAKEIINLGSATGADFVELFCEETSSKNFSFENLRLDSVTENIEYGVGVRLLKNFRSVYGYTNDISKSGLTKLVEDLRASFDDKTCIEDVTSFKKKSYKKKNIVETYSKDVPNETIIEYVRSALKSIKDYDQRIIRVTGGFSIRDRSVTVYNSDGVYFDKFTEYSRLNLSSVASENGKIETRFDGPGTSSGWKFFTDTLDINKICKNHAEKVILMLGAKECPAGRFPVIIGNGWGGVIFHEACGHQLEATSVAKGLSVFSGKKGTMIANKIVSAYDDATIPGEWGSYDIDDEGVVPKKNCLIKNGKLVGYLVDNFNGRRMNEKGNGASRRQSYKNEPTSRMGNTYIAPGKNTPEEIIANTKLAIYMVTFNGGSVNPATGDFNFGCSEAYIVKDGKIVAPVRGATLVGNARDILKHIDMVGNDLAFGQGMCGSRSGSIPVNVGQPTIRVNEIVVGGRGGSIDEF
ncbi:MAG: TldD/PmbA family protein [Clostridia bacterium]|nr:TldD/PmbA family protein [Clostridia bacterium]